MHRISPDKGWLVIPRIPEISRDVLWVFKFGDLALTPMAWAGKGACEIRKVINCLLRLHERMPYSKNAIKLWKISCREPVESTTRLLSAFPIVVLRQR